MKNTSLLWTEVIVCFFAISATAMASPSTESPGLFALKTTEEKGCEWLVSELPKLQLKKILVTSDCPRSLLWDVKRRRSFFRTKEGIFLHNWKGHGVVRVASTPKDFAEGAGEVLGISKVGELIVTQLEAVENKDVLRSVKGVFFRYQGKEYDASRVDGNGVPYMGVQRRLRDGKKWEIIGASATNWEAGDTLGFSVFSSEEMNPEGALDGFRSGEFSIQDWPLQFTPKPSVGAIARVAEGFKGLLDRQEGETIGFMKWGEHSVFLFKNVMGDTQHAVPPVFLFNLEKTLTRVETKILSGPQVTTQQLEIRALGDFALLTSEFDHYGAVVYSKGKSTPIGTLSADYRVAFLPFNGF